MNVQSPFVAGILAGSCGTIVAYPFDVIKTYSQLHQHPHMIDNIKVIYQHQGWTGFYRGLWSPLVFRSSVKGLLFATYERLYRSHQLQSIPNSYLKMGGVGIFAGITSSVLCSPMELIKISNQQGLTFRHRLKTEGWKIIGRGLPETIIRESPYYAMYFPLYHYCIDHQIPLAGGIAGTVPWIVTYPLDVIKTLKQSQTPSNSIIIFWHQYGLRGFYNGLLPTILRAFPTHYITWKVYGWLIPN